MTRVLLEARGLKTYYYTFEGVVRAVDEVSFKVRRGEIFGLLGESACGKSTVAHSITRLVPPPGWIVGGEVWFEGENLLEKTEDQMKEIRGKKISMIFQDPTASLNPVFKVGEQIVDTVMVHEPVSKEEAYDVTIRKLEQARLPDPQGTFDCYPHELSGGMKQRVMIAAALACNPSLLIADEPTSYLDVTIQAQILNLLRELSRELGMSVLLITHNLGIVAEICDKLAVMYAGRVVEISPVMAFPKRALHPYTQGLLRAVPKITEESKQLYMIKGEVPDLINPPSGCRFHPRCPKAKSECSKHIPDFIEVEDDHQVSCLLYGGEHSGAPH